MEGLLLHIEREREERFLLLFAWWWHLFKKERETTTSVKAAENRPSTRCYCHGRGNFILLQCLLFSSFLPFFLTATRFFPLYERYTPWCSSSWRCTDFNPPARGKPSSYITEVAHTHIHKRCKRGRNLTNCRRPWLHLLCKDLFTL